MDKIYIVVDGSNVAFYKRTSKKKAKFSSLEIIKNYLESLSIEFPEVWEIIVDATLQYRIDNKESLEESFRKGLISQCPDNIEADKFILAFYNRHSENTLIISNDNFKDHLINGLNIFKFVILFDEILFNPDIKEYVKKLIQSPKEVKVNV